MRREMAGEAESEPEPRAGRYRVVADRCLRLEASQAELTEQLTELADSGESSKPDVASPPSDSESDPFGRFPGAFRGGSPYRRILESIGHAVHVCGASSRKIVYWNHSAENLYGWKDHEVIGRRVDEILVAEEHCPSLQNIMEKLRFGQSWSGQFPLKKRSGDIFMATVTKSPLYEGGELAGVITVSSDAALFNGISLDKSRANEEHANGLPKSLGLNLKKIQLQSRPQIAPIPQIASSVSNLASKVLPRRCGDNTQNLFVGGQHNAIETDDAILEKPGKLAAKLLEKLHIKSNRNPVNEGESYQQIKNAGNVPVRNPVTGEPNVATDLKASSTCEGTLHPNTMGKSPGRKTPVLAEREFIELQRGAHSPTFGETSELASSRECNECFHLRRPGNLSLKVCKKASEETAEPRDLQAFLVKDEVQKPPDGKQLHSSGKSIGSHDTSSCKSDSELSYMVDCEICWQDLQLGEEIGQGSYAVVYRGMWKGSDVAIKVYVGNEYSEDTLQDYKKEIEIMKRLRHPNVLLFMGAVYSKERPAIVTEFMPRGSLFKTLHKNNQVLDTRHRLRMALDVARGMNYLHHRNPPIVHRDLKSSNLLVDKNWTVKVGDFGLSRLKNATLLTAKSGRGTPQWMAPEVLRNEPSNEKSDVFSFGVILWELMTESIPWNNLNSVQVVGVVGFMDRRLDVPEGIDPGIASLIHDCWQSDPDKRPSFEVILQRMRSLVRSGAAASVRKNPGS
ncbi:serine/threonine-protein kinase STY8 isoform X2 [Rhodamnia argentea]|uniref:non-specific serine/threonine protein kinase n=1 Tax=Rhodamnia argentea TaxID=178133 RepID=A0A8B8PTW2_9MYRT|nr:serine/threonine-protein kinase STY8 isoform X2 [Rhodamnia argentea]